MVSSDGQYRTTNVLPLSLPEKRQSFKYFARETKKKERKRVFGENGMLCKLNENEWLLYCLVLPPSLPPSPLVHSFYQSLRYILFYFIFFFCLKVCVDLPHPH